MSASCRTRSSSTLTSRGSSSGNPSSTVKLVSRPGVSCRFSSTSDSTDLTNGRSFSCLRSYMALRKPEVALSEGLELLPEVQIRPRAFGPAGG